MKKDKFFIAQVGRTVGLRGDLKLHLHTDFPKQFKSGITLNTDRGSLHIKSYDPKRNLIRFEGYESPELAKKLTNTKIYSDENQTRELCPLKEGEYYWFEILGAKIQENKDYLGVVKEIQRMLDIDYLLIETDSSLQDEGLAKSFLLPYIPRYILSFDRDKKVIYVQDARDVLEAS